MIALLDTLTDEQHAAVETDLPLALVSAGPGAGKTRVIAHRVAWLLDKGVRPEEVLALVFTRNACAEIRSRVCALAGPDGPRVRIATFHEYAAALTVWPFGLQVATEQEADAGLRSLYEGPTRRPAREIPKLWELRRRITEYEARGPNGDPAVRLVLDRLLAVKLVPTWDLVPQLRILQGRGGQPRFAHVLVDECQDTTPNEQSAALESVAADGSLYAVGDPRQAIMGWRGAAAEWAFGSVTHRLTRTFRFGRHVADVANACEVGEAIAGDPGLESEVAFPERITGASLGAWLDKAADTVVLCRTHRDAETVAHLLPERLRHVERDPLDPLSSAADSIAAVRAEGKVPVCTIHSYKGLEADQVVLFAPSTSDYWSRRIKEDQEERRVEFVATTRARKRLVVVEGDR